MLEELPNKSEINNCFYSWCWRILLEIQ